MEETTAQTPLLRPNGRGKLKNYLSRYWTLYLLLLLPMVYFIVFRYSPLSFLIIAFKNYRLNMSVFDMPWATERDGTVNIWMHFQAAFSDRDFYRALRNTVALNLMDLVVGFPAPIIMALLLNELPFIKFKKFTQTVSYMPHFLSWIIIASLATQLFAPTSGVVNIFLNKLFGTEAGAYSYPFLNKPVNWMWTYCLLGVWQNLGWGSIIYLAAMTGINPELYEAASVDGASRLRKIWHITLPGIRPTIITLLILAIGGIVNSNFDRPFALRNTLVYEVSDVLSIFVYNRGLRGLQFSFATAVGIFSSIINVLFLLGANAMAKKMGERGVW